MNINNEQKTYQLDTLRRYRRGSFLSSDDKRGDVLASRAYQGIVIERIEEETQAFPIVIRTEDRTFDTCTFCQPNGLEDKTILSTGRKASVTIPSAPTRPRPVTRNFTSRSQFSALREFLLQIQPELNDD